MLTSKIRVLPGKTMPSGNDHTIKNRQPHNEVNIHERINRCNTGKWNSIIIVDIQCVIWHNILVLSQYFNFSQIKKILI